MDTEPTPDPPAADPPVEAQPRAVSELIRHTIVYGSGYITMALASFLLVPVYTRHMSPSGYGLLGLMLVLYGLMTQVYDFGFTNAVGRFFFDVDKSDREASLRRMRATALTFLVGFGGVLTLVLVLLAPTWSDVLTQSRDHANLVRIVAVTLYAEALAIVPLTLIRMEERSRVYVMITLARFLVTLSLSYVFVVIMDLDVRGALLANAASAGAVLLVLLPDYRHAFRGRASVPLLREMLAFGVPFFPVLLSGWLIEASDRYLLGQFRTHAEVGYYVLGYKVAQVMQIGVAAFSMGWAPLRYKIYERPGAPDTYRRLTSYYVLASATVTVGIAVFARQIVDLVAPASYSSAAQIVPLIAAAYALNGLYILMVTGMGVAKKTTPMLWIVGGAATVNIAINLVLIPKWGMLAAAWTTVLGNAIMAGGAWWYSQKSYPISYDWARIARVALIGTAVVAVVVFVAPADGVAGLLCSAAAWIVFVLALRVTSTIKPEDVTAAREAFRRVRARGLPGFRREVPT